MFFLQRPKRFKPTLNAVGCFMLTKGEFLLLLRHPDRRYGNTWGLPAGAVERGETPEQAMAREIQEETGLSVPRARIMWHLRKHEMVYVRDENGDTSFQLYSIQVQPRLQIVLREGEHVASQWVTPQGALQIPNVIVGLHETVRLRFGLAA